MARKIVKNYAAFQNIDGSTSIVLYYQNGGTDTANNLSDKEASFMINLLRKEKPMSYDHNLKRLSTYSFEPVGEEEGGFLEPRFSLDYWLSKRTTIRNAINWEFPGGALRNYTAWTNAQKQELEQNYQTILRNQQLNLAEAPVLAHVPRGNEQAVSRLSAQTAWAYYLGFVAHSLVVEGDKRVNWSLNALNNEERALILDGRKFVVRRNDNTYDINRSTIGGVSYGNPTRIYRFMQDNDLIGNSHLNTIGRIIKWSRRMVHYLGGHTSDNVFSQWQYRGVPPIERVINGTPRDGDTTIRHRTAGCRGTTGFFRALLRLVNIPVEPKIVSGHALPYFPSVNRYFSHGDDPYSGFFRTAFEIPDQALLLTEAVFNQWFIDDPNPGNNIGRQTRELALIYLPKYLLKIHCNDIVAGRNHANSNIAEAFDRNYTVAQLEALNLWGRMDAKITALGGCAAIP